MEKNVLMWVVGIVIAAAFLFSVTSPTGNVVKNVKMDPVITVTNSPVMQGYPVKLSIRDAETLTQEFKVYEADGDYAGKRFFARASRCSSRKVTGSYDCDLEYKIPTNMLPGNYYIQAKGRRGETVGNKALFTVA